MTFWKHRDFPKMYSCEKCGDLVTASWEEALSHSEHGRVALLYYLSPTPPQWVFSRKYMLTTVTVFGVFIFLFAMFYATHLLSHFLR